MLRNKYIRKGKINEVKVFKLKEKKNLRKNEFL